MQDIVADRCGSFDPVADFGMAMPFSSDEAGAVKWKAVGCVLLATVLVFAALIIVGLFTMGDPG